MDNDLLADRVEWQTVFMIIMVMMIIITAVMIIPMLTQLSCCR
jgi:hypothetical protein